jgi:opine dehydrogenase
MVSLPGITVCGCGSGGMAMAADLSMFGCRVNLYEIPSFSANLAPIRENGGIHLTGRPFSGKQGVAVLNAVTDDPAEALDGSELIFLNVPAMAVEPFLDELAPHLTEGQVLVVTTGYWAALRNRELLEKYGAFDKFVFAEMNIMPYLSGKTGPAEVEIGNYKRELHISAWPATGNHRALEVVRRVYPQTVVHKNVLELNFWPGNPGVHPQITLPNAVFFFERAREFRFYGEVSRSASKLTDAHDRERMAIAAAYECDSVTWPEDCRRKYLYEGEKLHDIHGSVRDPHAQKWNRIEEIERLLVEDLCFSFIPMEALASVAGLSTPVTTAMVDLLAVLTGYEYRAEGLTLQDLGFDGMNREEIIEFATLGRL